MTKRAPFNNYTSEQIKDWLEGKGPELPKELGRLTVEEVDRLETLKADRYGMERALEIAATTHANHLARWRKDMNKFWDDLRIRLGLSLVDDVTIDYSDREYRVLKGKEDAT